MRQSIPVTFRPLQGWPGERTRSRQRSQFSAKWIQTMELLDRELFHVRAKNVVLQLDCDEREIRRDGIPRADARTRGPGVILAFDSPKGSLSFPCDRYTDWQDNVRAIALSLEALRSVDRHGVTRSAEQYRGWAALPDKSKEGPFPDVGAAAAWLRSELPIGPNGPPWSDEQKRSIRTMAIGTFHPDRRDGADGPWKLWQAAALMVGIEV